MPLQALQVLERKIERQIEKRIRLFERKNGIRLDDEVRFIKSWIEKPLSIGAVSPSGRLLARTMASFVDPKLSGPVIELGPGTGPVTQALVKRGIAPARLVLVEFNPVFCRLLRSRYPEATIVQGDAYSLGKTLAGLTLEPAAAIVSSLPLLTKPLKLRLRLVSEALALMHRDAPFVQFTYSMTMPPIPKHLVKLEAEPSERIWKNFPPARVWAYRRPRLA